MISIPRSTTLAPLLLGAALVAGCGSSASSGTRQASSTPSSTAAATGAASPYGASSAAASGGSAARAVLVSTKKHGKLGTILAAGPKHLTVYLFEADRGGKSACSAQCARFWPPLLGKAKASGAASASKLGTITRSDGKVQVTYAGHPLYLFAKDKDDGDAYGEGLKAFGADWYVLRPSGKKVDES